MNRIIEPLVEMGANIEAEGTDGRPPLSIRVSRKRKCFHYMMPVASATMPAANHTITQICCSVIPTDMAAW